MPVRHTLLHEGELAAGNHSQILSWIHFNHKFQRWGVPGWLSQLNSVMKSLKNWMLVFKLPIKGKYWVSRGSAT